MISLSLQPVFERWEADMSVAPPGARSFDGNAIIESRAVRKYIRAVL